MKILKKRLENKPKDRGFFGHTVEYNNRVSALDHDESKDVLRIRAAKTTLRLEREDGEIPKDVIKATYIDSLGKETEERRELQALVSTDIYENVSEMLASYEVVRQKRDVREIEPNLFIEEMIDYFKNDIHFSYKSFLNDTEKNGQYNVYVYHLILIFIGSVSVLNDVEYKPPIHIKISSKQRGIKVSFTSLAKEMIEVNSKAKLKDIQGVEAKLAYMSTLCREEGISSSFQIFNNTVKYEFSISEVKKEKVKLYSKKSEEREFFDKMVSLFNYKGREEAEEEEDL